MERGTDDLWFIKPLFGTAWFEVDKLLCTEVERRATSSASIASWLDTDAAAGACVLTTPAVFIPTPGRTWTSSGEIAALAGSNQQARKGGRKQ